VGHTRLHEPTLAELALLPESESQRDFGSARRKQQYLCARALLRRLLENSTGESGSSHELHITADGKPVCVNGPAISITHTGDLIACCLAEAGDVGIDLEANNQQREMSKVARKFFSAEESTWLAAQPKDRFFMLWVLKEAYVKAIGTSIFGGANRLRCSVTPPVINVLRNSDNMRNLGLYYLGGAFLALATTEESLADVRIVRWDSVANELLPETESRLLAMSGDLVN